GPTVLVRVESPDLDYGGSKDDFSLDEDCAGADERRPLLVEVAQPTTEQDKSHSASVQPKNHEKALRLAVQQSLHKSRPTLTSGPCPAHALSTEESRYSTDESRASEIRSTFTCSRTNSNQHPPSIDPPPPRASSSFLRPHRSALFVYRFPIPLPSLKPVLIGRNGSAQKYVSSKSGILHLTYSECEEGKPYGFIKGTKAAIARALELIESELRSSTHRSSAYERQQVGEREWLRFEEEKCEPFDKAKPEHRGYQSGTDRGARYRGGGARWASGRYRAPIPRRPDPATLGIRRLQPAQAGGWPERRDADDGALPLKEHPVEAKPWDPVAGPSTSNEAMVEPGLSRSYIAIPRIAVRSFAGPAFPLPHLERVSASKLRLECDTSGARIVVDGGGRGGEGGMSEELEREIENIVRVERGLGGWSVGDGEGNGEAPSIGEQAEELNRRSPGGGANSVDALAPPSLACLPLVLVAKPCLSPPLPRLTRRRPPAFVPPSSSLSSPLALLVQRFSKGQQVHFPLPFPFPFPLPYSARLAGESPSPSVYMRSLALSPTPVPLSAPAEQ
ncbi:hypothetical protein JCM1841_001511, partial [Sporobolomyces salmonicolor]